MKLEEREDFVDLVAQAVIDRIEERDRIGGLVDMVVARVFQLQQEAARIAVAQNGNGQAPDDMALSVKNAGIAAAEATDISSGQCPQTCQDANDIRIRVLNDILGECIRQANGSVSGIAKCTFAYCSDRNNACNLFRACNVACICETQNCGRRP